MIAPSIPYSDCNLTNLIENQIFIKFESNQTFQLNNSNIIDDTNLLNYYTAKYKSIDKQSKTTISDFNFNVNFKCINDKFDIEFEKYKSYISTDINNAIDTVNSITKKLSHIKYKDVAVELTPSNSIKFYLTLEDELLLTIIKPFDIIEDLSEKDVIFNIYRESELLISDVLRLDELVKGINSFI